MQSHHFPLDLKRPDGQSWGRSSKAFFATEPVGSAILFVHGFGGKATDTWLEFPRLLPLEAESAGYDLLFYGYDGKKARAAFSAAGLLEFLDALNDTPSRDVINPSLTPGIPKRPKAFRYKRLVICAHSLGAVVSRLALLDAGNQTPRRRWLSRVRLLAPQSFRSYPPRCPAS
jgi:pimeloyl-ACP methyl ester carboxylesterase